MATPLEDFTANLTAILDAVVGSKIYTDINQMYDDGLLQKDQYDKIIINFHDKLLSMAGTLAENIELRDAQVEVEKARKLLIDRQKIGFDDNKKIEKAKMLSEAIGMIQSGGNDAPQEFFDAWTSAINVI